MGCGTWGVTQVLIGLHRIGIVGLGGALKTVDDSGLTGQEEILDLLMDTLLAENYMPERQADDVRRALWREVLRHRGEDFSDFLSPVEVTVRGRAGPERDRFVDEMRSVFATFELEPVTTYEPEAGEGSHPQLAIGEHTIVRGHPGRRRFEAAVRQSFSDW